MFINIIISLGLSLCTFLGLSYLLGFLDQTTISVNKLFGGYDMEVISIFSLIMFAIFYYLLSNHKSKQNSFIDNKNLNSNEYTMQKPAIGLVKKSFLVGMGTFVCFLSIRFFIVFLNSQSYGYGYRTSGSSFTDFLFTYFLWIPSSALFSVIVGLICYAILKRNRK